jgi:hypothetical protein
LSKLVELVESTSFSPEPVHRPIPLPRPKEVVFPVVHTPYDYDYVFL